jgi:hypothetical protein
MCHTYLSTSLSIVADGAHVQYTWEEQDDDDESDKKGGKDGDVWKQDKVWKKAAKYLQVSMISTL